MVFVSLQTMKPAKVKITGQPWVLWLFIIIFPLIISPVLLSSADVNLDKHIGLNYVSNYNPSVHPQNWCIVQGKQGIIYVGTLGMVCWNMTGVHGASLIFPMIVYTRWQWMTMVLSMSGGTMKSVF
jgi:hypothetical protein